MEKAILKTLIYADLFDYPLKINEIHKWLIGPPSLNLPVRQAGLRRVNKQITLRQVEKALKKLNQESRIKNKAGYYFLPRRDGLVVQRYHKEEQSARYLKKAHILCQILKIIPWVKLVGISGGLALNNALKKDDIDLFIITAKNRLWVSRLLALGLLSLTGQRRKKGETGKKIAGKLCLNILLEEDKLEQKEKDIFVAHEVLQMKVLWQRDGIYSKYLEDNSWAFKFLPNWVTFGRQPRSLARQRKRPAVAYGDLGYARFARLGLAAFGGSLPSFLEVLAKWLQLKIMSKPQGMERIEDGALYFHPKDCRLEVLSKYQQGLKKIISP